MRFGARSGKVIQQIGHTRIALIPLNFRVINVALDLPMVSSRRVHDFDSNTFKNLNYAFE